MSQTVTFQLLTDILIHNKYTKRPPPEDYANMQGLLANFYLIGNKEQGVEQNYEEAFKWAKISADQKSEIGNIVLGRLYWQGQGAEKNLEQALSCFKFVANKFHDIEALFSLGHILFFNEEVKDIKEAIDWFEKTSSRNIGGSLLSNHLRELYYQGRANVILGILYNEGKLVPVNYKTACLHFFEASVNNFDTEGFWRWADMCHNQRCTGFIPNRIEDKNKWQEHNAHLFYLLSAIAGNYSGQMSYGQFIYDKFNNSYHAYIWYCLASANSGLDLDEKDNPDFQGFKEKLVNLRNAIEERLTPEAIEKAQEAVAKFVPIDMPIIRKFMFREYTEKNHDHPDADVDIFFNYTKKFGFSELPEKIYK